MQNKTPLLLCLALLLTVLPVPTGSAQTPDIQRHLFPHDGSGGSIDVNLDDPEDLDDTFRLVLDVDAARATGSGQCLAGLNSGDVTFATATLKRVKKPDGTSIPGAEQEVVSIAASRVYNEKRTDPVSGNEVTFEAFVGQVKASQVDFTTGFWAFTLDVYDRFGATHECGALTFEFTSADVAGPVIGFRDETESDDNGMDDDGRVILGASGVLRVNVTDDLLKRVEYRIDEYMPTGRFFTLARPYDLGANSFQAGLQTLIVRAYDRAGNSAQAELDVIVDASNPVLHNLTTPTEDGASVLYRGIPNRIVLDLEESSRSVLTVRFGDQVQTIELAGAVTRRDVVFSITPSDGSNATTGTDPNASVDPDAGLGPIRLSIDVVDAFGNRASMSRTVEVVRVTTDVQLVSASQDSAPVILGETVVLHAAMQQKNGLHELPVTVRVDGEPLAESTLSARGIKAIDIDLTLPPGITTLTVDVQVPAGVVERNQTNQTLQVDVEVFLGRVLVGDDVYHVRSDVRGVPIAAVGPDGKVYDLELVQMGGGSVYQFEAGNETLFWDPARSAEQEFVAPAVGPDDEESPGLGVVLVFGLLALLAVARRR